MSSVVVNVRVKGEVKRQAQKVAEEMGLTLSALINGFLKQVIKTKTALFTTKEEPTEYLLQTLRDSKEDREAGRVISFKKRGAALAYLDDLITHDKKAKKH